MSDEEKEEVEKVGSGELLEPEETNDREHSKQEGIVCIYIHK